RPECLPQVGARIGRGSVRRADFFAPDGAGAPMPWEIVTPWPRTCRLDGVENSAATGLGSVMMPPPGAGGIMGAMATPVRERGRWPAPGTMHDRWTAADLDSLPHGGLRYEIIDGTLLVSPSP